ncbi:Uncharacterised protein [Chlamydia trachomatis]|nr:Uncharacterised protein [Chlamydia trachomatis]
MSCGVQSLGVVGPNAPMELGVNNWQSSSRAVSKALTNPPMFKCQAKSGFFSAVADNKAAKCIIVSTSCFFAMLNIAFSSVTSKTSNGPD